MYKIPNHFWDNYFRGAKAGRSLKRKTVINNPGDRGSPVTGAQAVPERRIAVEKPAWSNAFRMQETRGEKNMPHRDEQAERRDRNAGTEPKIATDYVLNLFKHNH